MLDTFILLMLPVGMAVVGYVVSYELRESKLADIDKRLKKYGTLTLKW